MTTQKNPSKSRFVEDLRLALMRQELHFALQPKVCTDTNKTIGAEVLLRWQHPTEGIMPADHLVFLAQTHNLMGSLNKVLLNKVIHYLQSNTNLNVPLAINVTPACLDGEFADYIVNSLAKANIPSQLLEIEITESTPISNMTNLADAARLLQSKGLKVYLDDFGTGYTTMQYWIDIPIDGVKMDKSLVQKALVMPTARLVLRALIQLAQEIGHTVVCEGVETLEQLALIKKLGAKITQGYLTGRPMEPEAFTRRMLLPPPHAFRDCDPQPL